MAECRYRYKTVATILAKEMINMGVTLAETVDQFLKTQFIAGKSRTSAANILKGGASDGKTASAAYIFLSEPALSGLLGKDIEDTAVRDMLPAAIHDSESSYTRDKNNAIKIYQQYTAFLRKSYGVQVEVEFPPLFNSAFDRQMYIVKSLHENRYNAAEIAGKLWLSEKTISEDMSELEDGISILGQRLSISRRDVNGRSGLFNSIHPLFLVPNLTQVVVLLQGLRGMAADKVYHAYAMKLASNIWSELSDYARTRIMDVAEQIGMDQEWFADLENSRDKDLYSTELECSYDEGPGNVLDFIKNRKRCSIEVVGESGVQIWEDCRIIGMSEGEIVVHHNKKDKSLPLSSVARASEYGKCIF